MTMRSGDLFSQCFGGCGKTSYFRFYAWNVVYIKKIIGQCCLGYQNIIMKMNLGFKYYTKLFVNPHHI